MNNYGEKRAMNFNEARQTSTESTPTFQMHNFMPMPSSSRNDPSESEKHAAFMNELNQNMQFFWRQRLTEICEATTDVRTQHTLPLARIKKVMKSDERVKMISADTPVLFAKACEIFVMELSMRAWMHTQLNKRRTVQRNDVAYAIRDHHLLAFLKDVVPMESHHQEVAAAGGGPVAANDQQMMNLQNINHGYFRSEGLQHNNPGFAPPSSYVDGTNPYLTYKDFFQ